MNQVYRYQSGGPALPRVLTDPREVYRMFSAQAPRSDLASYYSLPGQDRFDRDMAAMALQREQLRQKALAELAAAQKSKPRGAPNPQITRPAKGDLASSFQAPTQEKVENYLNVRSAESARTQQNLQRLGYNPVQAAYLASKGPDGMLKTAKQQLDDQAIDDYRVKMHPDFDPSKSVDEQQHLKFDDALKTRLLRGRNMLLDTGDPVSSFLTDAITYPGKAFINLTMDADKQYFQPGVAQGLTNLGTDLMAVFPSGVDQLGSSVANKIVGRSLPEGAMLLQQGLGRPIAKRFLPVEENPSLESMSHDAHGLYGKKSDVPLPPLTNEEIKKSAYDYYNLTKDPRYLERVQNLDKNLGLDGELEKRLELYHKQGQEDLGKDLPFNIKIDKDLPVLGRSDAHPDVIDRMGRQLDKGEINYKDFINFKKAYLTPQEREILLSPTLKDQGYQVDDVLWHEKKHHWLNGLDDEGVKKYSDWLKSVGSQDFLDPKHDLTLEAFNYYGLPTEKDAYLMTELRNDMVRRGYLDNHFDNLTTKNLNDYIRYNIKEETPMSNFIKPYFMPRVGLIGDKKKFVSMFNKALPVGAGAAVGVEALNQQQDEQRRMGGSVSRRVPRLPVMGFFRK